MRGLKLWTSTVGIEGMRSYIKVYGVIACIGD